MNFGQAILILFALSNSADGQADQSPKLRGLATTRSKNTFGIKTYEEELGSCTGAVCGLWGDPHIISCDGLGYDCNAAGLFTLMNNFLYNIQANFIHVTATDMRQIVNVWKNPPVATITQDIIIQNLEKSDFPVHQFSFPSFHLDGESVPSEYGCLVNWKYDKHMMGQSRTEVKSIVACREHCDAVAGCVGITFYSNGGCHLADISSKLIEKTDSSCSRSVAGKSDKCGHPSKWKALSAGLESDVKKAKIIGNGSTNKGNSAIGEGCPLLFYENKVLQDISTYDDDSFLFGSSTDDSYVKLDGYNKVKIVHTTENGSKSEIMLEVGGAGPGELMGCHWNIFVCLPKEEQEKFKKQDINFGLFGSPNENSQDDWMTPDGTQVDIPTEGKKGPAAFDYCTKNWCVSQENSEMAYPSGGSYDTVKCQHEKYVEFDVKTNPACYVNAEKIIEKCDQKCPMMVEACQKDSCYGDYLMIDEVIDEITGFVTLSDKEENIVYNVGKEVENIPLCEEADYFLTGETACPSSSGNTVKVIHQSVEIPNDEPVIYGITFQDSMDDNHGREVTFRVANPFGSEADTYVRYQKKVGEFANDPACESMSSVISGCDLVAPDITVGCIEYRDLESFAVVDVYFATKDSVALNADTNTEVEKCCKPPVYGSDFGIIKYTFKIQCSCPDGEQIDN